MRLFRTQLALATLSFLLLVSAFMVIASTHSSRALYADLQGYEARRWYMEEEYSRLLLEQSTWASHHRIASEAGEALGLHAPDLAHTRLVVK